MPAPKKDPSIRARANKASTAAVLRNGVHVVRPELPPRVLTHPDTGESVEVSWNPQTVAWWDDLWSAPMAAEYHSSDRHALFLLAVLVDQFWRSPSQSLAGEIRLQRQAFGLTPYDRRRLEWTIESTEEAKDRGKERRSRTAAKQPAKRNDPRLALVN